MGALYAIEYLLTYLFTNIFGNPFFISLVILFAIFVVSATMNLSKQTNVILLIFLVPLLIYSSVVGEWSKLAFAAFMALVILLAFKDQLSGGGF
jgi:small-conductance mechanosensitive channel